MVYSGRMFKPTRAKWLVTSGVLVTSLGIVFYSQLEQIVEVSRSPNTVNAAAILSFTATILGLLLALAGSALWASTAPLARVFVSGVSVATLAILLIVLVNVNVHGPTALFLFVIPAAIVCAALLLLKATSRYLGAREQL